MAAAAVSTPWSSTNDPKEYVGCKIEIISNSDIRYSGTLYVFDQHASTVSLRDVRSFGTEGRRPADQKIAATEMTYEYIVFRVSDIKELVICEPPATLERRLKTVDSAIVSASDEQSAGTGSGGPNIRLAPSFAKAYGQSQSGRGRAASEGNAASGTGGRSRTAGRGGGNNNGGGRGSGTWARGGRGGRAGYSNTGRRAGPSVFPYPNQNDSQDWLTRYQKDMNLKAEFQNVNPDLAALAKVMTGSQQLPPEKIRDIMEGNLQAFMMATEMPGKEGNVIDKTKPMFAKDGFFDELTNPPPSQSEAFYNRSKDLETFGPAVNNNRTQQQGQRNGGGQNNFNQGGNRQAGNSGGGRQQNGNWSGNQGGQGRNRSNNNNQGSWNGGNNSQGSWNGGNNGRGQWNGGNNRRGRGGNRTILGSQALASMMNRNNGNSGFTQRDLVIPNSDWNFSQRAQTALWTPGIDAAAGSQSAPATNWTFTCSTGSEKPMENGYEVVTPSPSEEER